ncbi:MAG TPA: holo-ACP synthase [Exilispira sp.]|jgi:holo-[acyl-carrier protein] synthase|nr:holo-ACP synthase [Exilispira sp.]
MKLLGNKMIVGIGTDIVDIDRFSASLEKEGFIDRLFTENEQKQAVNYSESRRDEYFAGRFALKESFYKAIGTGIRVHSLKDVEILYDSFGKPILFLKNMLANMFPVEFYSIHATIAHERKYAIGFVIIERIR